MSLRQQSCLADLITGPGGKRSTVKSPLSLVRKTTHGRPKSRTGLGSPALHGLPECLDSEVRMVLEEQDLPVSRPRPARPRLPQRRRARSPIRVQTPDRARPRAPRAQGPSCLYPPLRFPSFRFNLGRAAAKNPPTRCLQDFETRAPLGPDPPFSAAGSPATARPALVPLARSSRESLTKPRRRTATAQVTPAAHTLAAAPLEGTEAAGLGVDSRRFHGDGRGWAGKASAEDVAPDWPERSGCSWAL